MLSKLINKLSRLQRWFFKKPLSFKLLVIVFVIIAGWLTISKNIIRKNPPIQYQTATVERGTLIVSVTASGKVASFNNIPITTKATGVVKKIYVLNGQEVKAGDKIAEIDLDRMAQQQYLSSLASYQNAKNNLETAKTKQYSLQANMFNKWKNFKTLAESSTYTNNDGSPNETNRALAEFHIAEKEWLAAEAEFKNQQNVINQAQIALSSAWLSVEQLSPTIYAPIGGTIVGLSLQEGSVITSTNTDTTNSSQKIGSIITATNPLVLLNLTEIDVTKVKVGNKATITFDALAEKTYTGTVISVDKVGSTTSGVTSYPAIIRLETVNPEILPNMNASASIITQTKDNVLLIPTSAVLRQNSQSFVRVIRNGTVTQISVEIGLSSDSQTEVVAGLNEGDTIVTSITTSSTSRNSQNQSPFGLFGGNRSFGGGTFRIQR